MTMPQTFSLVGLLCITVGSIAALLGSPSPKYRRDWSIGLASEPDKYKWMATYRRQKNFRKFLFFVAIGAALQVVAIFLPPGMAASSSLQLSLKSTTEFNR